MSRRKKVLELLARTQSLSVNAAAERLEVQQNQLDSLASRREQLHAHVESTQSTLRDSTASGQRIDLSVFEQTVNYLQGLESQQDQIGAMCREQSGVVERERKLLVAAQLKEQAFENKLKETVEELKADSMTREMREVEDNYLQQFESSKA